MRRLIPAVLASLLLAAAPTQEQPASGATAAPPSTSELGEPAAVPDGAPDGTAAIDRQDLHRHASWLAGDERNGRHTGSAGQRAAADYVAEQFEQLGLKPLGDRRGYLQQYPLHRLVLHKNTGLRFATEKITTEGFAVLHSDEKDKVRLSGRFVYCGNGTKIPSIGKARIPVIALSGKGRGGVGGDLQAVQRYIRIAHDLKKANAKAGVVCLLDDTTSLANTLNYKGLLPDHGAMGVDRLPQPPVAIPLMVLAAPQSQALLQHLGVDAGDAAATQQNEKASGKLTIQVNVQKKATACNVVAVLEGTSRKNEAVVISAHHDHVGTRLDGDRFNGADDNASGTSGLLELAEAFSKANTRPARSIVFLSVSGEELGLWGSAYYAEHPTWPKARIVADVNVDMIGRAERSGGDIRMQVTPSHAHRKYSTLVQDAVSLAGRFGITFSSGDTYYARSDHYNFAKIGIPVVFFCDGEHPDYHQVTDHADKLDYAAMEAIVRLAYWTTRNVADSDQRPKELGKQPGW